MHGNYIYVSSYGNGIFRIDMTTGDRSVFYSQGTAYSLELDSTSLYWTNDDLYGAPGVWKLPLPE